MRISDWSSDVCSSDLGQHARPPALASVLAPVVDVTTDVRLEAGLRDRHAEQVVLPGLEVAEALHEQRERSVDRGIDDHLSPHHHIVIGHAHSSSSESASVISWTPLRARLQNASSWPRRAATPASLDRKSTRLNSSH